MAIMGLSLNYLKNPEKSIFTFERTIKNKLTGINQGEPNEKAGYSYEKAPNQQHFLGRERTVNLFRQLFAGGTKCWRFNAAIASSLVTSS